MAEEGPCEVDDVLMGPTQHTRRDIWGRYEVSVAGWLRCRARAEKNRGGRWYVRIHCVP